MLYRVDYLVNDMEKFKAEGPVFPKYVLAEDFDSAVKTARKFESDVLSLTEVAIFTNDGHVAIARGFKGASSSKGEEAAAEVKGE